MICYTKQTHEKTRTQRERQTHERTHIPREHENRLRLFVFAARFFLSPCNAFGFPFPISFRRPAREPFFSRLDESCRRRRRRLSPAAVIVLTRHGESERQREKERKKERMRERERKAKASCCVYLKKMPLMWYARPIVLSREEKIYPLACAQE